MSSEDVGTPGSSRRTVLKAGLATGVGLVAWSAPSITSLGGTPAYALGCTFVQEFDLADCRNTTQQSGCTGFFSYQPLDEPAGFTFTENVGNNVCCEDAGQAVITIPSGLECKAVLAIYGKNPDCVAGTGPVTPVEETGVATGSLTIPLTCIGLDYKLPSGFYNISLFCNSVDAPPECLDSVTPA